MFSEVTIDTIVAQSRKAGIDPAAMLALVEIESGGKVSVRIDGRERPLIRFEGHYFDRRLSGPARDKARSLGLASPKAGAVKNPRGQAARWAMYRRAAAIDAKAAIESVSWGIGQVMGAHWAWLGYASADALFEEANDGLDGQLRLMLRFVAKSGIMEPLKARRWRDVARIYNGPAYARYAYHTKLAAAEKRWRSALAGRAPAAQPASGDLALGARGDTVRLLQEQLAGAGYVLAADGIFGRQTRAALLAFQQSQGLEQSGIADEATRAALAKTASEAAGDSAGSWLAALVDAVLRRLRAK